MSMINTLTEPRKKKNSFMYPNIYCIFALTTTELFKRTGQLIFFDTSVHNKSRIEYGEHIKVKNYYFLWFEHLAVYNTIVYNSKHTWIQQMMFKNASKRKKPHVHESVVKWIGTYQSKILAKKKVDRCPKHNRW